LDIRQKQSELTVIAFKRLVRRTLSQTQSIDPGLSHLIGGTMVDNKERVKVAIAARQTGYLQLVLPFRSAAA
jgi:hypothetical protein